MVIFNSYVKLPEGKTSNKGIILVGYGGICGAPLGHVCHTATGCYRARPLQTLKSEQFMPVEQVENIPKAYLTR